jgi:hypothetical protein
LAILTFLIQLALFLTKTNNNLFHTRNSISLKAINAKIDSLEKHITTENPFTPHFLGNYIEKIPAKSGINEYFNWKAGIYCMLSKDTTFYEYLNVKGSLEPYPDLGNLLKQLSVQNINIDTTPFYFAYSVDNNDSLLKSAFIKIKQADIKSIKVVFVRDSTNIEHLAFDSSHIANIKSFRNKLIAEGKSPAEALALAIQPSMRTCPPFMIDLDSITGIRADQRTTALIKSFRKNANCNNCNIQKSIDIGFLLSVAWITYSVVDCNLAKLISGAQKL